MLESPQISLSAAVLARIAQHGGMVIACGPDHLPAFAGLPFVGHSRLAGVQRMQLDLSLPFRKRCWQSIIRAKIANQAQCLRLLGREGAAHVAAMAEQVTSGDAANVESSAAHAYFRFLFGQDFDRRSESGINSALNYGYAVIRAAVARALAAHGFLLTQGIHHSSELNPFNLADDFLEPLRPVVDLRAASFPPHPEPPPRHPEPVEGPNELDKARRQELVGLLACDVGVEGEAHPVLHAADLVAASFTAACHNAEPALLKLPDLLPLHEHGYE